MAKPIRTSKNGSASGTRVPGGPSGNVDTTVDHEVAGQHDDQHRLHGVEHGESEVPGAEVGEPLGCHAARHGRSSVGASNV